MKVLLVNPPRLAPKEMAKKVHAPQNLLYLATSLAQKGGEVSILDANAENLNESGIIQRIVDSDAELVGFPVFSDILHPTAKLIAATRSRCPDIKILLGGIHVTAIPEQTAQQIPQADYLLSGYAEDSICQLVQVLENNSNLDEIAGLTYRKDGQIHTSRVGSTCPDVNALPIADRSFVRKHIESGRYYQIFNTLPFDSIVTGRGCPHHCHFCYNSVRDRVLLRSAESIYEEILLRYREGVRFLDVDDDNFMVNRTRARKIFSWILRDNLKLQLFVKSRTDTIDKEILQLGRKAGVNMISFGIESGSQRMLDAMNKGTTVQQNAQAIAQARRLGMYVHTGFFIGYPGETRETISQSIAFVQRSKPDAFSVDILKPYPETVVYRQSQQEGNLIGDWNAENPQWPWVKLPWTASYEDLLKERYRFLRQCYLRPHYAFSLPAQILRTANLRMARYATESLLNLLKNRLPF